MGQVNHLSQKLGNVLCLNEEYLPDAIAAYLEDDPKSLSEEEIKLVEQLDKDLDIELIQHEAVYRAVRKWMRDHRIPDRIVPTV